MIRVLIANHHRAFRDRLSATLRAERDIEIVGEAEDGPSAIQLAHERRPEVLLLDLSIPGTLSGLEVLRELARALPDVRIVVVSVDTRLRAAALSGGAAAFVWKGVSPGELLQEVRKLAPPADPGPQRLGEHLPSRRDAI